MPMLSSIPGTDCIKKEDDLFLRARTLTCRHLYNHLDFIPVACVMRGQFYAKT